MNGRLVPIRNCSVGRLREATGGVAGAETARAAWALRIWGMRCLELRRSLNAEALDPGGAAEHEVEHHPGEEHRREHIGDQPDDERDREPADRAGAEEEQEHTADDRGDV